jgi:hypothetical protein
LKKKPHESISTIQMTLPLFVCCHHSFYRVIYHITHHSWGGGVLIVLEDIKTVIRSFSKEVWAEEYIAKLISAGLPVPTAATVVAHGLSAAPFLAHILQPPAAGTLAANLGPSDKQLQAQQIAQTLVSPSPPPLSSPLGTTGSLGGLPSPPLTAGGSKRSGVSFAAGTKANNSMTSASGGALTGAAYQHVSTSTSSGTLLPLTSTDVSASSSDTIPIGVNPLFPIFTKWVETDNLSPRQIILAVPLSSSWIRCFLRVLFHPVFKYDGLTSLCLWNTYCGDKGVAHIV